MATRKKRKAKRSASEQLDQQMAQAESTGERLDRVAVMVETGLPIITIEQLAELLNISVRKAWDLVAEGHFPRIKVGGRLVRFSLADVVDYVQRQRCSTAAAISTRG